MHFKFSTLVVCGVVALSVITGVTAAPIRTTPTQTDLDGLTWLNAARTNPKSLIPDMQAILCKEFNPVPSPGPTYDIANTVCSIFGTQIYPIIAQLLGQDPKAAATQGAQFCDTTLRTVLGLPSAADPTCKVLNMNLSTKIYTNKNGVNILTTEGAPAVEEAINFLKNQPPTYALTWNQDVWNACRDHVEDQGPASATGHTGGDGSSPSVRMGRYANVITPSGENLAYGSIDAKDAVIQLIIDDGVADRGHRTNIFLSGYLEMASFFGTHTYYRTEMCQNFVAGTYSLSQPTMTQLMSTFQSEAVTFTTADGQPASYSGYTQSTKVEYSPPRQLKKTVSRNYTLPNNGGIQPATKILYQDLPPKTA